MLGTLNFMALLLKLGMSLHSFLLVVPPYEMLQRKGAVERGKSNIYMQDDVQWTSPGSANTGSNAEPWLCS